MNWESLAAFLDMGGSGPFVWGSYGVTAVLIIVELWMLSRRRKDTLLQLYRLQQLDAEHDTPQANTHASHGE